MSRPDFDLAAIYRSSRQRLLDLARTLDSDQLATAVPTCPAWTVHDTYAHLTGLGADALSGVSGWIGSPDNTARQVESRRRQNIATICDEWTASGPGMENHIVANRISALAMDAWTHEQDIHNALGLVADRTGQGRNLTASSVWRLKRRFREESIPALRIVTEREDWLIGDADAAATLHMDGYELARMVLGRRSRSQMLAYDWDGEPEPYIDLIPVFTPPITDIVE